MDEHVGVDHFFERGTERLHELVWKSAHEPDGVGEQHDLTAWKPEPAGGGIEGGEEAVLHEDVGIA